MKNILLLFISSSMIWSCSNQSADNAISLDSSETKGTLVVQTGMEKSEINASFPFGCKILNELKYPMRWEAGAEKYGHLKTTGNLEFEDIGKCYDALNSSKTIKSPQPHKLELLEIGDNFKHAGNLDTLMQKSIDSCRFRLPNIGNYECYYYYLRYGNLMLLDPKTNTGKVLNIFANDLGNDSHTGLRYFLIDNNAITIYDAYCYDDGCSLNKTYKIVVNSNGEMKVNQLNN